MLNGENYLSGIDADQYDQIRVMANKTIAPAEQGLSDDIERAIGRIENSVKSFREGFYPRLERWAGNDDATIADAFSAAGNS